jgi:hypothetical protein
LEARYIESLNAPDYAAFRKDKVDDPTPGTLGWFLNDERFRSWQAKDESSILWIKGSPGQGKTILTKFLLTRLESSLDLNRHAVVIYFFFYDQDDNLQTVSAALRSLIRQLLSARDAFQIISFKFNIETSAINEDSLWEILDELLRDPIFGTIYCVVDPLDECRGIESRHRLLRFLKSLIHPPPGKKRNSPVLKALLVSRPTVELDRELKQSPSIHIKANPHDLETFIRRKINVLELDTEHQEKAIELLTGRAERTFLWISIVLKKLEAAAALLSPADMERIIDESPSDLTELYEGIVNQIIQSNDVAQQKLLI